MALEIIINNESLDLSPSAVIAITRQIGDIKTFNQIKGDVSNSFEIPPTDKNKRLLEAANAIHSTTQLPYSRIPVKVIQDGVEVIKQPVLVVDTFEANFRISVYAGNVTWAALLEGKKLRELNFEDTQHRWNTTTIINSHTMPNGMWIYAPVEMGVGFQTAADTFQGKYLRPWVYIKEILFRIFDEIGYTITGDLLALDRYPRAIMECNRVQYPQEFNIVHAVIDEVPGFVAVDISSTYSINFPTEILDPLQIYAPEGVIEKRFIPPSLFLHEWRFNAEKKGKYKFQVQLQIKQNFYQYQNFGGGAIFMADEFSPVPYSLVAEVHAPAHGALGGTNAGDILPGVGVPGAIEFFEFDVDVTDDNSHILFRLRPNDTTADSLNNYSVNVYNESYMKCIEYIGDGATEFTDFVNPGKMLPDMSQTDFVKGVAFMFGQAIIPDPIQKSVRFRSWQRLSDQKPYALNWSDKEDHSKKTLLDFRLDGWAQNNWFRYKKEEGVPENYGDSNVTIADSWLPYQRDVITLPFGSSITNAFNVPLIERGELNVDEPDGYKWKGDGVPRVLITKLNPGSITIDTLPVSPYYEAYFKKSGAADNLGFDDTLINDYYEFLSDFVLNPRLITAHMMLSTLDIENFDPFLPVYIDRHASYFYVNKISNWVAGKACKVELLRL